MKRTLGLIIMFSFLVGIVITRAYGKEYLEKLQWHLKSRSKPSEEIVNNCPETIIGPLH